MRAFNYSEADLEARSRNPAFESLMRYQADRIHGYYQKAEPGLALLDERGRFAVRVAFDLYRKTLRRIEASGFDVFRRADGGAGDVAVLDYGPLDGGSDHQAAVERQECLTALNWPACGPQRGLAVILELLVRGGTVALQALCRRFLRRIAGGSALPDCMVVIPARNEEAAIGRAVRSLPHDTVIVVDDHSDGPHGGDGARGRRGALLPAPELPRKGVGKSNACAAGAEGVELALGSCSPTPTPGSSRDSWKRLPGCAEASGLSLLSIYLDPEYKGIAEHALAPYARALAFCGLGLAGSPQALFTGQCLLARRSPTILWAATRGGHAADGGRQN